MSTRNNWTREETLLALNLYCKIPFGKMHSRNPLIANLANLINRTPSAVALKLCNLASIDPDLPRKGMGNYSKKDKEIWDEFYSNRENLFFQSEELLAKLMKKPVEEISDASFDNLPQGETERQATIKTRINQSLFRKMVLISYDNQCCITGIKASQLLIASHIAPWAKDKENRLNPRNGLCLNALHDKAFDCGLISLSDKFELLFHTF